LPSDTLEYCSRYIFEDYLNGSDETRKRFNDFAGVEKYVSDLYKEYNSEKVSETSTDELLKLMDVIRSKIWRLNCSIIFTHHFDKEFCLDALKNTGYPISTEQLGILWDKATHPAIESFEKAQQRSVLKAIAENKSKEFIIENARFIFANFFGVEDMEMVAKKIDNEYGAITDKQACLKLDQFDTELKLEKSNFNAWFNSLSKNEQHLVWYLQRIIEYRDRRKNLFAKAYVIWWLIYEKVLREAEIDHSLITYIQFDELMRGAEYLRSIKTNIESRKNGSVLLIEFEGTTTIEPLNYDEAKIQLTDFYVQSTTAGQKEGEIKGQTGSPGTIRGIVKIVLNASKSEKFEDGDILVTGMTRPEFVSLMKRSSAVITDEGGITCHAAIVSRELKIPCVIGTKIATRKLKDGDMVEVDATNGIVRILENK
jgi:phosphoenolpyruvate synthase/pyruvate phosphate dikinase